MPIVCVYHTDNCLWKLSLLLTRIGIIFVGAGGASSGSSVRWELS